QCAEARKYATAETHYRKALELAPGDPEALRGLAHALLRMGKIADAEASLAAVPRGRRPDPSRLLLEAALLAEKGDDAGAEKALVQATTLAPADLDPQVQLTLLRLRRVEAAAREKGETVKPAAVAAEVALLQKAAVALPERGDIRYAQGYAHEIAGQADLALEDYREATRLDPLDGDSITALGALLLAKGLLDDAAREFLRALDREPDDGIVLQNLAYVYDQQGKTKEALDAYQKLVKLEPKNARAWHGLGLALDAAGKGKESAVPLQKAVDLSPATGRYHRDLGEALVLNNRTQAAEAAFLKAVELDPKDDAAWDALGRTRREMKKYAESVEAYEKVVELRPKDEDVHLMIAVLCHEFLKDWEKAVAHYNRYLALGGETPVEDWLAECQAEIDKKKP
ncbi:MAG: tetratricopeptide repeat protein, partial [Planctomycetes bacterium]|nr:tetratricopeptide repeat protein [Planctomycetota bacterium]